MLTDDIHSLTFHTRFPSVEARGAAAEEALKIHRGLQQPVIVSLAPHLIIKETLLWNSVDPFSTGFL